MIDPCWTASTFGEAIGFGGADCETKWYDFVCVGIDLKANVDV